jgi:hypothetical protein
VRTIVPDLEEVPEPLHGEYEQQSDGTFHLKLEGDTPRGFVTAEAHNSETGRTREFRDANTALLGGIAQVLGVERVDPGNPLDPLRQHLAQFNGIDPEEHRRLKDAAADLEKKGVTKADDIAGLVATQVREQVTAGLAPLQEQLKAEQEARATAEAAASQATFRDRVWGVLEPLGARPTAKDFLIMQAEGSFENRNGDVAARSGVFSISSPGEPLPLDEWAGTAVRSFDFAFGSTRGGGEPNETPGGTGIQPGVKQLVNPTREQLGDRETARMIRERKLVIATTAS